MKEKKGNNYRMYKKCCSIIYPNNYEYCPKCGMKLSKIINIGLIRGVKTGKKTFMLAFKALSRFNKSYIIDNYEIYYQNVNIKFECEIYDIYNLDENILKKYDYLFIFNTSQSEYNLYTKIIKKYYDVNPNGDIILLWTMMDKDFEKNFIETLMNSDEGKSFITRNGHTTYMIDSTTS